jgi:Tfp pilus assembly protein PilE
MFVLVGIAIAAHIVIAALVAWAVFSWRNYVEENRKNTEREP